LKAKSFAALLFTLILLSACSKMGDHTGVDAATVESLKKMASTDGFLPYNGNPVITMGPEGSWDAGALGSMTVVLAEGVFHLYYEAWGVRSEKMWDAAEYESLQIGHATSVDGINWVKDPDNPVLLQGEEGEWDETGVWDPYVIYEDGLFKMWYGGGGGRNPNYGWAYAESEDGTNYIKEGLIGTGNQSGVEDVHVVHDKESGLYYLYYWHGHEEGEDLFYVTSPTERNFNFDDAKIINIVGDDSFWCKFGHVLRNDEGWHMFYSNYIPPHGPNSIVRYASSEDGIHWHVKNKRLIYGLDADVLQVTDDLYMMVFAPENHFDKKDADIRIAIYNGTLAELASKPPFIEVEEPGSLVGKSFEISMGDDPALTLTFKIDNEVVLSEESNEEDPWTFNAFYIQNEDSIHIMGEDFDLEGIITREKIIIID